jgi:cytochrome c oxidase cbb3-type subunit III
MKGLKLVPSFALAATLLFPLGCSREKRTYQDQSPYVETAPDRVVQSDLHPGMMPPPASVDNKYEESAYAVAEGQKLFDQYHCSGCHFHGGGGIGPPLMDADWTYGSAPQNIRATILEGRPNGMPSFRGKIPDHQVWEIVAYVRSLSGLLPKDVSPGRSDDISMGTTPQQTHAQHEKKEQPGLNREEKPK